MAAIHSSFFFNDTATTEIYTLSLHDALRSQLWSDWIFQSDTSPSPRTLRKSSLTPITLERAVKRLGDRKSTRLNSSHGYISYAVFCLKKKTENGQSERDCLAAS